MRKIPVLKRKKAPGRAGKIGLPPGTLVHTGEQKEETVRLGEFLFDEDSYREESLDPLAGPLPVPRKESITWLNLDGLHDIAVMERIGQTYRIHPLMLEDVLSTGGRPKFEEYDGQLFIVLKMISFNDESRRIDTEQLSLILGDALVLSFQERVGDVLDCVRDRIRSGRGRVRKERADYLAYTLIDAVVDSYFIVLEKLGEKIDELEEELIDDPDEKTLHRLHELKREMIDLRRSIWPLRELVNGLAKSESPLIRQSTRVYLRDVYDHTIQIIDTIESYRDIVSGMLDIYLSSVSNRMNSVMKVLTIIATLFIPLTFFAGVYGMNFRYMPELEQPWAYPAFWVLSVVVFVAMLLFFRRKKWL
jgi:magnesium transporter